MDRDDILSAMRGMAWERAKAELESIKQADFPPASATPEVRAAWDAKCERRRHLFADFIKTVEDDEVYL